MAATDIPARNIPTEAFVVEKAKANFNLVPIILDEVRENEVLVEVKYCGICHTDIVLQQGIVPLIEFPAIFGHEGAGIVRAVGKGVKKHIEVGDAVLLSFFTCGNCNACRTGFPASCHFHAQVNQNAVRLSDRSTPASLLDGTSVRSQFFGQSALSRMSVVPEQSVVKCPYPESLSFYAPLGCGFQTGAGTVLNQLKPSSEDIIVVFGLGSVGLSAVMAAKYLGAKQIIGVDIVEDRLALAKEVGASDVVLSTKDTDVVQAIKTLTSGAGAQRAIDCTGNVKVIETMIAALGPSGFGALVGVPPVGAEIRIDALSYLLECKRLEGVLLGASNPPNFIPQLIELQRAGHFPIEKLCKTYPITQLDQAISDMKSGKVIKPVISWNEKGYI